MAKVRKGVTFEVTHRFLSGLFGEDVHAKRVYSLANATLGVISSASLAVNSIGQGLALARGRLPKHAIKQVDRLLSNPGIDVDEFSKGWVAHAVGPRPKQLMTTYGKRWGIESGFRDTKDLRFGMGMASIRVSTPERRDRLWLLNAFAVVLLTLLGAAGEALGYDRYLKSNTSKKRTHSLFRQGAMLYELIPMMPEPRLRPLVERFGASLLEIPVFNAVYGII